MTQEAAKISACPAFRVARAAGGGSAETRFRHGSVHCRLCVIVKLPVFFRRSAPVEDIRFVPHLKVPGFHFPFAVALFQVGNEAEYQMIPFLIILGRHGPAHALVFAHAVSDLVIPPVFGISGVRQVARHKTKLEEGLAAAAQPDIDHTVDHLIAVHGVPVLVLDVDVGGAPFVKGVQYAGAQHVVSAHVIWLFKPAELFYQFHAAG